MDNLKFDDKGLIVAIAQDVITGEVLMQAYMNKESLDITLKTGKVTYYSRSRQKLWTKGETSGHYQKLIDIRYDCDGDCILVKVIQEGAACHTGNRSCFYRKLLDLGNYPDYKIIYDIIKTIKDRKVNPKKGSYTNYLIDKGKEKICKKIGEESSEVIIATMKDDKKETIMEIADLIYHILVLMNVQNIDLSDVFSELMAREGKDPDPKYLNKK